MSDDELTLDEARMILTTEIVLAWLKTALRTWPEAPSLPEDLESAPIVLLAEARSRMADLAESARQLRLAIDERLAEEIGPHGAVRLGDRLLRPPGKEWKIVDTATFWSMLAEAVRRVDDPTPLLLTLFNAGDAKLTGLKHLAAVLDVDEKALRATLVAGKPKTSPIIAVTMKYWPNWALQMKDGEAVVTKAAFPDEADWENVEAPPAEDPRYVHGVEIQPEVVAVLIADPE